MLSDRFDIHFMLELIALALPPIDRSRGNAVLQCDFPHWAASDEIAVDKVEYLDLLRRRQAKHRAGTFHADPRSQVLHLHYAERADLTNPARDYIILPWRRSRVA